VVADAPRPVWTPDAAAAAAPAPSRVIAGLLTIRGPPEHELNVRMAQPSAHEGLDRRFSPFPRFSQDWGLRRACRPVPTPYTSRCPPRTLPKRTPADTGHPTHSLWRPRLGGEPVIALMIGGPGGQKKKREMAAANRSNGENGPPDGLSGTNGSDTVLVVMANHRQWTIF